MGNCCCRPRVAEGDGRVANDQRLSVSETTINEIVAKQSSVYMLDTCEEVVSIIHGPTSVPTPTRSYDCVDDFMSVSSGGDTAYDTPLSQ